MAASQDRLRPENVPLLQCFDEDEFEKILGRMRRRKFEKGQIIIHHMSEENDVFFLLRGRALAFLTSMDGIELAFGEIPLGCHFGEIAAIDGGPRSASICALTEVEVAQMSAGDFLHLIEAQPKFALAVIKDFTKTVRRLSDGNFELATKPVNLRVRSLIVRMALEREQLFNGGELKPALTHAEIATRVGARREAVSRSLGDMVDEGLIETGRQSIKILDAAALTDLDDGLV